MFRIVLVAALFAAVLVEGQLTGTVDGVDDDGNSTDVPRPPKRHCPRGPMERLACKVVDDATGDVLKERRCRRNGTECTLGPLEIDTPENDSISIYFCNDEFNQQLAQRLACRIEVEGVVKKEEACMAELPCSVGPMTIEFEGGSADAYFCELPAKKGHRKRRPGRRFGPFGGGMKKIFGHRFGPRQDSSEMEPEDGDTNPNGQPGVEDPRPSFARGRGNHRQPPRRGFF